MTLAECKQLKKGDPIRVSLGGGWWMTGKFDGIYPGTSYGRFTIDQIDQIDWKKGRKCWVVNYEYEDGGRTRLGTCDPRSVRRG